MGARIWKVIHDHEWLLLVLTAVVVLRIPSLFEPYWYGDEGIYLTIGRALRSGTSLYQGIHDNKPPFLYLLAAVANGNQFWFRLILLGWQMTTISAFCYLAKLVANKGKGVVAATWAFALFTTLPMFEGNIANAELFFLLPVIGGVVLLWKKDVAETKVFWAGILFGLAAMFKAPAILEMGVWPIVWILFKEKNKWRKMVILGIACLIPIFMSGIYYAARGTLSYYLEAAWMQNIPYLSSWQQTGAGKGIFSVSGRALVALGLVGGIGLFRKGLKRGGVTLGLWAVVGTFSVLLSGRPYPHYFLQAATVLALGGLMLGMKRPQKTLAVGIWGLFAGAFVIFNFYTYPTVEYYKNFTDWIVGKKDFYEYINYFDGGMTNMYQLAEYINSQTDKSEKIFVWGDKPMLYALSKRLPAGRYTAKYHIEFFRREEETLMSLERERPRFVICYDNKDRLPGLSDFLERHYADNGEMYGARVYRYSELLERLYAQSGI